MLRSVTADRGRLTRTVEAPIRIACACGSVLYVESLGTIALTDESTVDLHCDHMTADSDGTIALRVNIQSINVN